MIDKKGLSDKEVQDLIEWRLCNKTINEHLRKRQASKVVKEIIYDIMEEPNKKQKK